MVVMDYELLTQNVHISPAGFIGLCKQYLLLGILLGLLGRSYSTGMSRSHHRHGFPFNRQHLHRRHLLSYIGLSEYPRFRCFASGQRIPRSFGIEPDLR